MSIKAPGAPSPKKDLKRSLGVSVAILVVFSGVWALLIWKQTWQYGLSLEDYFVHSSMWKHDVGIFVVGTFLVVAWQNVWR
jgi:hypothetical protein